MLGQMLQGIGRLITLRRDVDQLRGEVEELRADLRELGEDTILWRAEMLAALAKETAEREKFMLQVQNLLLQWERRLPAPVAKPARPPRKRAKPRG